MFRTHTVPHTLRKKLVPMGGLIVLVLALTLPAAAQTPTLVSGTVKDVNGVPYSFAQVSASLTGIPPNVNATILVNGVPTAIGGQQNANADVNGNFTMSLFCNTAGGGCSVISPSGTSWQFTVNENGTPPPLGTGPQKCSATLSITGASQSISSSFSTCPALSNATGGNSNPSPANLVDPTQSQFAGGAKPVLFVAADGSSTSGSNQFSSASASCSSAHAGDVLLAIDTNNVTYNSAFTNYIYGSSAGQIAIVSTSNPCTGPAWNITTTGGATLNANFTVAGTAVWALAPPPAQDAGAAFNAALLATLSSTNSPGKQLAIPCGGPYMVLTVPFVVSATASPLWNLSQLSACPNGLTSFIVHPNDVVTAPTSGGTQPFFAAACGASNTCTFPTGAFQPTGSGTSSAVRHILLSSLDGLLPGTNGTNEVAFFGFNHNEDLAVFGLSASNNTSAVWFVVNKPSGEGFLKGCNFQDAGSQGSIPVANTANWFAFQSNGQGMQSATDCIVAFPGFSPVFNIGPNAFISGNYLTQTGKVSGNAGLIQPIGSPPFITAVGNQITGGNTIFDDTNVATQLNFYGNIVSTPGQAQNIFNLQNAGTVLDLSGNDITPTSGGTGSSEASGLGLILNRGGNRLHLSGNAVGISTGVTQTNFVGVKGACTGTFSATAGTYNLPSTGATTTTCAGQTTTIAVGTVVQGAGHVLENLTCTATAAGGASATCGVFKNGASVMTCSLNGVTSCVNNNTQVAVADGDFVSVVGTVGTSDTLAGLKAGVAIDP